MMTRANRTTRVWAMVAAAAFAGALLVVIAAATKPAHAVTRPPFTVNSTGDAPDADPGNGTCQTATAGECTLRAAIEEANAFPGADTINFDIPTTGLATISPGSDLPAITKPVTIDGYTQSGATENTIPLAKDGTNAVLKIALVGGHAQLSLAAGASNSVIRGLVIGFCANSPCNYGINLSGGTGYKVEGNFLGTQADGTSNLANMSGVILRGTGDSTIGGASPAARNLISGNIFEGVLLLDSSSGNTIEGNLIGPDKNGNPKGNGGSGVGLIFAGNGNRILSNSIFSNSGLGIDLSSTNVGDGVTANDPQDPDTGPNNLQNYPEITSAITLPTGTSIKGTLDSTPSTKKKKRAFIIQFFSNPVADSPSGYGEGKTFLGELQVKTDKEGKAPISFATTQKVPEGVFITATATNKAKGDTSEFSKARVVEGPVVGP